MSNIKLLCQLLNLCNAERLSTTEEIDCFVNLLKTIKIDFNNRYEVTDLTIILWNCAKYDHYEMLKAVLVAIPEEELVRIVNFTNSDGYTALHNAAEGGSERCVVELLKIDVLDINSRIDESILAKMLEPKLISRSSALDLAVQRGHKECVVAFVNNAYSSGKKILRTTLATAIYCAELKKDQEIIKILNTYIKENYPHDIISFTEAINTPIKGSRKLKML